MKMLPLLFIIGAVISWGAYVPTIHHGQHGFAKQPAPVRAFLFVGVAYFLVAIIVPGVALLVSKVEPLEFAKKGIWLSTLAGVFGAMGAVCVIYALKTGGKPTLVAPLVFAGAPIMNTFVAMTWDKPKSMPSPAYFVGILLAAVGAGLVLAFKPK